MFIFPFAVIAQSESHPRIYTNQKSGKKFLKNIEHLAWKKGLIDKKVKNLEKYLDFCKADPTWMVSRLQMNWKTKHTKVFLKGGEFSHSSGEAPVATVRYSGTRDWATDYKKPKLEDVVPYFDDEEVFILNIKKQGKKNGFTPLK
jgi:hypothetical protein